ncbi:Sulfotransferase 1E1 [Halotydeus destructor]|nr:Sulfotransferase 1E1 [Halotydeus destructor]
MMHPESFNDEFSMLKGIPVQVKRKRNNESAMKYDASPEDIFIVAYPKTGITWMGQIVTLLLNDGKVADDDYRKTILSFNLEGTEPLANMRRPFAIKSHFPYELQPWNPQAKYIILIRNPKDVAASRFYSKKTRSSIEASFDFFFDSFYEGKVGFGSYFHWYKSWAPWLTEPNVKLMVYENMITNPKDSILDVAAFLGYSDKVLANNGQILDSILEKSSFDKMKEQYSKNPSLSPLTRKGIIGDWRNIFDDNQSRLIDTKLHEEFRETPYENLWIDYDV